MSHFDLRSVAQLRWRGYERRSVAIATLQTRPRRRVNIDNQSIHVQEAPIREPRGYRKRSSGAIATRRLADQRRTWSRMIGSKWSTLRLGDIRYHVAHKGGRRSLIERWHVDQSATGIGMRPTGIQQKQASHKQCQRLFNYSDA